MSAAIDRSGPTYPVARYAFAFGMLLALYASLRPFHGWTDRGVPAFAFLHGPLVFQWWLRWDVFLNVAGYVALGFAGVLAGAPRLRGVAALAAAVALLALFSVSMESLQTFLPQRSPSIADFVSNVAGAIAGGLLALLCAPWLTSAGGIAGMRNRYVAAGATGDLGLFLLGLWLVGLAAPRILAFGMGDARLFLGTTGMLQHDSPVYVAIESLVAILNLLAAAALVRLTLRDDAPRTLLVLILIGASIVARTSGYGVFWRSTFALDWLTSGALIGIGAGLVVAVLVVRLSRRSAVGAGAFALVAATILVNLAPPDPTLWRRPRPRETDLAPLSVATRTVAMLWPAPTLAFLLWPRRRRADAERLA